MEFNNIKNDIKKRVCAVAFSLSIIATLPSCTANQNKVSNSNNSGIKVTEKDNNTNSETSTYTVNVNSDGSISTASDITNNSGVKNSNINTSKTSSTSNNTTSSKSSSSASTSSTSTSSVATTSSTIDNTKKIFSNNYLDKSYNSVNPTHVVDRTNQFKPDGLTLKSDELYITTYGDWHYVDDGMGGICKINAKTGERKEKAFGYSGNAYLRKDNYLYICTAYFVRIDLSNNDTGKKLTNNVAHSMCTNGTSVFLVDINNKKLYQYNISTGETTEKATGVASNNVQLNWNNDAKKVEVNNKGTITSYSVN